MEWPEEILAAFEDALEVVPADGLPVEMVYQALLDDTLRRAVWRAGGDPAKVRWALNAPYTPLGSLVNEYIGGRAERMVLRGPKWCAAVDAFNAYVEANAEALFAEFQFEAEPYDDPFTARAEESDGEL